MKWNDLTMKERSELMGIFLRNGIDSLSDMRKIYDEGGSTNNTQVNAVIDNPNYKSDREGPIYKYLINKGLNDVQASALVGNLAVESLLDANAKQIRGTARELGQWEGDRLEAIRNFPYIYEFGSGVTPDEQRQLDAILSRGIYNDVPGEWRHGYGFNRASDARQGFLSSDNPEAASDILMYNYFRPGKPRQNRRRAISKYYYDKYKIEDNSYSVPFNMLEAADKNYFASGGYAEPVPNTYTIQPGDTLSSISNRLTGKASNYMEIAAANNIENPDLIYAGQELIIPTKYDRPLKLEEIPTNNKIHIIDNYSPNYNYIVENDKIYYSRKDRDHWVDISDNNTARKNLYTFLYDKYDLRGYEDEERKIFSRIKNDNFNYTNYRDSLNNDIIRRLSADNKKFKKVPYTPVEFSLGELNNTLADVDEFTNLSPIEVSSKMNIPKDNREESGTAFADNWIEGVFTLGKNYIKRKFSKVFNDDKISEIATPQYDVGDSEYGIIPNSYTGDTLKVSNNERRYIVPESLDMTSYILGARNRGDYDEINSEAAPITAFTPFKKYGEHSKGYNTYIGIDANGKLKVGNISEFSEGDLLTGTYSNKVYSFAKDSNGHYIWKKDNLHGNSSYNIPGVYVENEDTGQKSIGYPINILQRPNDSKGETYGNITGGRVLVKVGNELRLLSGSVSDIEKEFESMKKRQGVDFGIFYSLDNGSYNRGLRTYDRRFTEEDLRNYDAQNTGNSGNFLYIKGAYNQFPSDTVWTPNVRTKNSQSYKEGHSDVNEVSGVVLHHTAFMDPDLTGVTNRFLDKNSEVSSHVVIGYDGKRRVFAEPDQVTFHAGQSYWNNRDNVNDFMIGIEFQGDTSKKPLTDNQIQSAVEYLAPIIRQYNISLENITTHQKVRDLYNQFRRKYNLGKKADSKPDISLNDYTRIIEALKDKVYYKK